MSGRNRKSSSDVERQRTFIRDVAPMMALLVVVQGSLLLLDPDGGASTWNMMWSLLPMLPASWLVWAQVRSVRRADEYQRVIQLQAMSLGFGTVVLVSLLGGLLDAAGIGSAAQSLQITFIAGVLTWMGALGVLTWRAG
jgi:hypothetical protein